MNYYASYGHTDFTLCLGYAGDQIRSTVADAQKVWDFASNWTITCVDTGLDTPIGERLHLVADSVAGEEMFFANYSDVLTDVDLDQMVSRMKAEPETDAMFLAVKPQSSFHIIDSDEAGKATKVYSLGELPLRTNGGYLLMRPAVLKRLGNGKDIVPTVFSELVDLGRLTSYHHDGFWMPADTFKERAVLHELWEDGHAPWRRTAP
jgi:glucose-1-phosphate cytidylyltransferase